MGKKTYRKRHQNNVILSTFKKSIGDPEPEALCLVSRVVTIEK